MKKLTLNQTWRLCLKMWKWIAKQIRDGSKLSVDKLKRKWLKTHTKDAITNDCYFCEYDQLHSTKRDGPNGCNCPGNRIEKDFGCMNSDYHFEHKPLKFYAKLLELDKKRKAK